MVLWGKESTVRKDRSVGRGGREGGCHGKQDGQATLTAKVVSEHTQALVREWCGSSRNVPGVRGQGTLTVADTFTDPAAQQCFVILSGKICISLSLSFFNCTTGGLGQVWVQKALRL